MNHAPKRPGLVIFAAVIMILAGSWSVFGGICGGGAIGLVDVMPTMPHAKGQQDPAALQRFVTKEVPGYYPVIFGMLGLTVLVGIAMIAAGIGVLRMSSTARVVAMLLVLISLLISFGRGVYNAVFVLPAQARFVQANPGPEFAMAVPTGILANIAKVCPNPGHHALVELETRLGADFTLVTQNVDGLHQAAGNQNVLEIHGCLRRVRCVGCERVTDRGAEALPDLPRCEACAQLLRPDVVWLEEPLPEAIWKRSVDAVQSCDCFLVVGTSAVVYPAAGLIDVARMEGADVIEVNLQPSAASARVDVLLLGPSGTTLPELIKRLG
jgi:NAD-dependent deacetylase